MGKMAKNFSRDTRDAARPGGKPTVQAAALGYVVNEKGPRYLLVTSRRTRRWIFPKGSVNTGETAPAAAARELAEEAGAIGDAVAEPIGRYRTLKLTEKGLVPLEIDLYPVRIRALQPAWPDAAKRERRILPHAEAARLLATPEMVDLLDAFHRSRFES